MPRICVVAALLVFACPSASAADSVQEMLSACRPIAKADVISGQVMFPQNFSTGYCWGAFTSIQKVIVHTDENWRPLYAVCAPPGNTLSQLIAILVAFGEKNPQRLHEDFFGVALESFRSAFPCRAPR